MSRALDIFISLSLLIAISPILLVISFVLKLTGEGLVIYKQQRIGKGGAPFDLIKFVTMLKTSPNIGSGTLTIKNDPRILPFGKFLRRTKVNELLQLWNVLIGDMTLVGPRPQAPKNFDLYSSGDKSTLIQMKPGLTGLASIIFRDEESLLYSAKNAEHFYAKEIMPYKARLELWYFNHRSITLDIKILLTSVYVVLMPNSNLVWFLFSDIPSPPGSLKTGLAYPLRDPTPN